MNKIKIEIGGKKKGSKEIVTKSNKLEELDESFIIATTLFNVLDISDKELNFDIDKYGIIYLPPYYVEFLREYIIRMYQKSKDPIERGYNSKSNLYFTLSYVKDIYNSYKIKRWKVLWKSAYIFYNLNSKHPFTDGNKRTALITCNSFLEHNGYSIGSLPYRKSYTFIKEVADGKKTLEDCFKFLHKEVCIFEVSENTKQNVSKFIKNKKKKFKIT